MNAQRYDRKDMQNSSVLNISFIMSINWISCQYICSIFHPYIPSPLTHHTCPQLHMPYPVKTPPGITPPGLSLCPILSSKSTPYPTTERFHTNTTSTNTTSTYISTTCTTIAMNTTFATTSRR